MRLDRIFIGYFEWIGAFQEASREKESNGFHQG
jgi:hypothetical protein